MVQSKENIIRAIRFERPDYIPVNFSINDACWQAYEHDLLFELMETHPLLFPHFQRPSGPYAPRFGLVARRDEPYSDDFGCLWQTTVDGITGVVTGHPLRDWSAYADWTLPDPEQCSGIGPVSWPAVASDVTARRARGELTWGALRHGHTFLQLCDLRGYENLLYDMADETPLLWDLIRRLETFNAAIIRHYLDLDVDMLMYAEDLGMQNGPMLSPAYFRKYIKPSYRRLMQPARDRGKIVHMHSDGHLHDLIDDLLDGGVEVINLQDLVNGIDWIAQRLAGRVCVELDIDRQQITTGGTPEQIDELIRTEVSRIGRREGGLMLLFGLYPGTPVRNIKALMDAMERYAGYFN
ncbi:MAG: hypothetical protein GX173_05775 [Ruminococcaceae bacterium]|jgi:hypothetical protein|nr:hypothetical protein [Oscillospiraceae bacterium]